MLQSLGHKIGFKRRNGGYWVMQKKNSFAIGLYKYLKISGIIFTVFAVVGIVIGLLIGETRISFLLIVACGLCWLPVLLYEKNIKNKKEDDD
jgi:predicted Co/Zn/Cd cation transporter (cation efflux family)